MSKTVHFEVSDEEEAAVAKTIQPYRKQINDSAELLSLLYDIDLLPEQIPHAANAIRMVAVCSLYNMIPTPSAVTLAACKSDNCRWPHCKFKCLELVPKAGIEPATRGV